MACAARRNLERTVHRSSPGYLLARRDAVAVEGRQRPSLTGEELGARYRGPRLGRDGGHVDCRNCFRWNWRFARRQEVDLPITREMGHRVNVALRQQGEAALAGGETEFTGVAGSNIVEGDIRKAGRSDISAEEGAASHTFQCQEAAGRNADPFEQNR